MYCSYEKTPRNGAQVKYDTFITVYMSDCDFYPRVRAAGYETLNSVKTCPDIKVKVRRLN